MSDILRRDRGLVGTREYTSITAAAYRALLCKIPGQARKCIKLIAWGERSGFYVPRPNSNNFPTTSSASLIPFPYTIMCNYITYDPKYKECTAVCEPEGEGGDRG